MKHPDLTELQRRSKERAEELRHSRPRLYFGDCPKSLPRLHHEDCVRGLGEGRLVLPRRLDYESVT